MKKIFLILFIAVVPLLAQKVTVVEDIALTSLSEGNFYYPTLNPDGTGVLFSSENYKGLWYKNFSTSKTVKITEALGAGYEPGFGISNEILYRDDKFVRGKKFSSLISYDMVSKKAAVLEGGIRDLKICRDNSNAFKNYVKETEVCFTMKQKMLQKSATPERVVFIQDSKIVLSENNTKKVLQPLGEGNYIWPSLSPDKTKLLFTFVGKGTYISNLEGAILTKIGYANYPSWSPDGNWVLFMKDIDDGVNIISSDVYIANLKTGKYFNLTLQRDDISLYPKWGAANSEIFYNIDNGQIRKIKLKY
jgi:Tol biopolymer transport system component